MGSFHGAGMSPQSFTPYGKNFSSMDAAAWSDIHSMFSKAKPSIPLYGIEELTSEAGSESGCESLVDDETDVPIESKRLLPSMGGFHGAGGLFGGVLRSNTTSEVHQEVLVEAPVPAADKSFHPSKPAQKFTPYGENFSTSMAAWSAVHARFSKAKPSVPLGGTEELSIQAGSESTCESLVDHVTDVPVPSKRLLPSMGGFHGAGGLFGGVLRSNTESK